MRRVLTVVSWLALLAFVSGIGLVGWLAQLLYVPHGSVPTESLTPSLSVSPFSSTSVTERVTWEALTPELRDVFEREVYGAFPQTNLDWNLERRLIDDQAYGGLGVIEELILEDTEKLFRIPVVLVTPKTGGPTPLIIASHFCANHNVFPEYTLEKPAVYPSFCDNSSPDSFGARFKRFVLGTYIETAPVESLLRQGFSFATFYTGSIVPDSAVLAPQALQTLSSVSTKPVTGVISAWAWGYLQVMHALEVDARIDPARVALFGHSRDGKAVLLASAYDASVDAVISHQSGTGGAAPSRRNVGESIAAIMESYPYWFDASFLTFAGREEELTLDQHFLLALSAPRPVLLTGARLDRWADPKGSFMALRDASYVYNLYQEESFSANTLTDFVPTDTLAFFMRPLNHGTRASDWNAFTAFLQAHFMVDQKDKI